MKKLSILFGHAVILASLMISSVFANEQVSDTQIYQLMDKSGATRAIEGLPLQMQAMGQQMALTAKDPSEHQKFMEIFLSSMDTEVMLAQMLASIRANVSQTELTSILQWLETDLASKIVKAELQSAEPEFQQNLTRYLADLQATPPSTERTQAIIYYVESSQVVEQAMKMMMEMIKNMFEAVKVANPNNQELATNLDAQLAQMATSMRPALEQQMILTSYFIYKDISDAELAQYSDFYQQEIGKKYLSLLIDAMGSALNGWGTSLVNQIVETKS
jgi:hypothetical protein